MVDAERLQAILDRIVQRLAILDEYAAEPRDEVLADRRSMGDCKYTFQTAIEACLDAAMHVVASEQLGVTDTSGQAFQRLVDAGLLPADLGDTMVAAVGFRNVLVHGYADVDDGRVLDHLANLPAIRRYVAIMAELAATDQPSGDAGPPSR